MQGSRVLLVYPEIPETFWNLTYALGLFGKEVWSPPLGLATVASMLPKGCDRKLYDLNVEALPDWELEQADYVLISAMDIQRESTRKLLDRCREYGVRTVGGGPLFTSQPEEFPEVDHLVLNEAEKTFPEFLRDLAENRPKHLYQADGYANMEESPLPDYSLIRMKRYGAMSVQLSRGCPYQCEFCDITHLFGRRPRVKTAQQIIAELDQIYEAGWREKVFFVDDNLMGNKPHLKNEVLPAILKWRSDKKGISFHTQISLNLADDQELMDLMCEAGFDWVFIGIETPNEDSLQECRKHQNFGRSLPEQIRKIQHSGLQVQGGFIVGFDNDPRDIFEKQFRLIQENGIVMAMVGILQALNGTELHKRLQHEGRLLSHCSGNNVTAQTNFVTRMDWEFLRKSYLDLVAALYEPRNYYSRLRSFLSEYNDRSVKPLLNLQLAFGILRCLTRLGVLHRGRVYFWRTFFWVITHKSESKHTFLLLASIGYHFCKVCEHQNAESRISSQPPTTNASSTALAPCEGARLR